MLPIGGVSINFLHALFPFKAVELQAIPPNVLYHLNPILILYTEPNLIRKSRLIFKLRKIQEAVFRVVLFARLTLRRGLS